MAKPGLNLVFSTVLIVVLPVSFSWAPKRTNEDVSYYYSPPEYTFQTETEPSCEELRAIWRLTKRTAQQSILSNEIHNPAAHFGYVTKTPSILDVKPGRGLRTRQNYGKVLIQPHQAQPGEAYDEVAKKLKTDVLLARNRPPVKPSSVVYAPLDPNYDYTSSVIGPSVIGPQLGKPRRQDYLGDYDKDTANFGSYQTKKTQITLLPCREIASRKCYSQDDCDCYDDVFTCLKGRCRSKTIQGKVTFNTWDDNNTHDWLKTPPETPNSLKSRNKESWRKSLRRTDRKKVGAYQDYYSQHNINRWT
uniref:WAP domain-containing protein n=1 Tax=Strigamia maritima TaxID=126957 RepID=T1IWB8_STRMM